MPHSFKAICIFGPTASGKTQLAHNLVDHLAVQGRVAHIVNIDAFQIYKGLDAGTAKPTLAERIHYNYHGLDLVNTEDSSWDANRFANWARATCQKLHAQQIIPICVGGSGLYLRSFLHGLDALPPHDPQIRTQIRTVIQEKGSAHAHAWLAQVDPTRAAELHPNDASRIERALEIFFISGIPMSTQCSKQRPLAQQALLFLCYAICLDPPPEQMRTRIETRVKAFLQESLWQKEVEGLYARYGDALRKFFSFNAIGYKSVLDFLVYGTLTEQELKEKIVTETWQYAKRQKTWNKKEYRDIVTHDPKRDIEKIVREVFSFL